MSGQEGIAGDNGLPPRRRRSFLAARHSERLDADTVPIRTEDDDLPVLTDVVPAEEALPEPNAPASEAPAVKVSVEELAAEMTRAISEQMAYELPTLIEATLLNASEELRAGITATMETALREFITRRKQLSLPLEDTTGEPVDRG